MRITGLASGLDMDKTVSDSMRPYRIKIDQTQQKRDIIEMKQQLYRDLIKDSRDLYNKYFDVSKKDSLLLSSSYGVTKFTTSNEGVLTVKGSVDAKAENYEITGKTAKAAKAVVTSKVENGEKVVINGKEFTLDGANEKERVKNLNAEIKKEGINVSVRYSDFAGTEDGNKKGLIFESTILGKDSTFTIGGDFTTVGTEKVGENATAASLSGFNISDLKDGNASIISIGGKPIEIGDITDKDNKEIEKIIQEKIGKDLEVKIDEESGDITFTSKTLGSSVSDIDIQINNKKGTFKAGKDGIKTTNTIDMNSITNKKISINRQVIDLSKAIPGEGETKEEAEEKYLNKMLESQGIEAKMDGTNLILTSKKIGSDRKIDVELIEGNGTTGVTEGRDTEIIFKDSRGGVYKHTGNSNTITLDGVTFNFSGEIPDEGITVNGKTDAKESAEKIVAFINDYNTLIEKLNTMTSEKRNKNYMPLTEEQKKDMSETEIKLWNEKTKKGQLNRDNDITRISNKLKQSMATTKGSSINLESIGIKPVKDYGTKNGTFTVDIDKLIKSLEENPEEVMNLFIGTAPAGATESEKADKAGAFQKMKTVLYDETVTITSSLIKKVGIEGSSTVSNNNLTKSIEKYNKKMEDLEKNFKKREQALYSKYSRLEVTMNKYNSQQSMMAQQFGGQ